jgi:hypothetical protein
MRYSCSLLKTKTQVPSSKTYSAQVARRYLKFEQPTSRMVASQLVDRILLRKRNVLQGLCNIVSLEVLEIGKRILKREIISGT